MHLVWTRPATNDLDTIEDYLIVRNPVAAIDVVFEIIDAVEEQLAPHPHIGRPGKTFGTREFVVPGTPYVVMYRVVDETLELLRVLHGARKWPAE